MYIICAYKHHVPQHLLPLVPKLQQRVPDLVNHPTEILEGPKEQRDLIATTFVGTIHSPQYSQKKNLNEDTGSPEQSMKRSDVPSLTIMTFLYKSLMQLERWAHQQT